MRTLADARRATLPHVPPALVSAESRAFWSQVAWPVPPSIGAFAWECRLGNAGGAADVQVQLASAARPALAAMDPAACPEEWVSIAQFIQAWAGKARSPVVALFVEMDEGGVPMLFPRIEASDNDSWLLIGGTLLHRFSEGGATGVVHRALIGACQALPDGASPLYVAWMGARGTPVARFIASIQRAELGAYLTRIAWEGDAGAVQAEIDRLNPWSSHVPIGFDVGPGASSALGVELHWSGPPRRGDRTHRVLDQLSTWPELAPERVEAARQWLDNPAPELGTRLQLKIGFGPSGRSAKAYLGAWTEDD